MNWLSQVLEATKRAESPRSFLLWAGIAAISSVANNKVWIDKRIYKLYPNLYVILIANSGLRKNFPVTFAETLVRDIANTRVIAGRSSVQSIIQVLGKSTTIPNPKGGHRIIKDATALIAAKEMSTSLVRDEDGLTILTDLFDSHKIWVNTLKSTGKETLNNVCLTILGAINPTHFADMISAKEIGGGFIARCILVLENKRDHKDSLLRATEGDLIDYEKLENHLHEIAKLSGPFTLTDEAINTYEEWYHAFEPESLDDKTGTANRVHDQILKVAMILSMADGLDLTINQKHISNALDLCLTSTASVNRILAGSGIAINAPQIKLVIQFLLDRPGYTADRGNILRQLHGSVDRFDLDRIVDNLLEMGGIKAEGTGANTVYTLTEKAVGGLKLWRNPA